MKKLLITATALLLINVQGLQADEKYQHFPAIESTDLQTALCNVSRYNKMLAAITTKSQMTTEDMVKVHELTYTLENAINFLKAKLEEVSVDLEDVHKASERLDAKVIKDSGEKYLNPTNKLISFETCP